MTVHDFAVFIFGIGWGWFITHVVYMRIYKGSKVRGQM